MATSKAVDLDGFVGYDVHSEKTTVLFTIFVVLFVFVPIGIFVPIVSCLKQKRNMQKDSKRNSEQQTRSRIEELNMTEVKKESQPVNELIKPKMIEALDGIYFVAEDVNQKLYHKTDLLTRDREELRSVPADSPHDSRPVDSFNGDFPVLGAIEQTMPTLPLYDDQSQSFKPQNLLTSTDECEYSGAINKKSVSGTDRYQVNQKDTMYSAQKTPQVLYYPTQQFTVGEDILKPISFADGTSRLVSSTKTILRTNDIEKNSDLCNATRNTDRLSNAPSAATTSRLHDGLYRNLSRSDLQKQRKRSSTKALNVLSRGKALSRKENLERSVEQERQYVKKFLANAGSGGEAFRPSFSATSSEAAGRVLGINSVECEATYYCRKFPIMRSSAVSQNGSGRRPSYSMAEGSENFSIMQPLDQEAIGPDDAASNMVEPGRSGVPIAYTDYLAQLERDRKERFLLDPDRNAIAARLADLLDLAETDHETKRIATLAISSTMAALLDPLVRIILISVISYSVNTDSMVAYVLVNLVIRVTMEEISGAIVDAESNMLQDALLMGGDVGQYQAGQFMQLAILMQLLIGVPVLVCWIVLIDNLVFWLVGVENIAIIASQYTAVIIIDYMFRGLTKTFMLPFYISGQAKFEATVDFIATLLLTAAIGVIYATSEGPNSISLASIGWIQVIIGVAVTITKIAVVTLKGWLKPFRSGLLQKLILKVRFLDPVISCFSINSSN